MISDAIALLELILNTFGKSNVPSALFDWEGNRIEGDDRIKVNLIKGQGEESKAWWYCVEAVENYQFIRIPVNASAVIESLGAPINENNRVSDYFRYIPTPDGHIYGGTISNVKVNFMIFAYRPSDLLSTSSPTKS